MADTPLGQLVERFLAHHAAFFPVDATFMGLPCADHALPPVDLEALTRELAALAEFARDLDALPAPESTADRLDMRLLRAALVQARLMAETRPRFRQPNWYSGEAAFGLISLLLPSAPEGASAALRARLAAMPAFLDGGSRWLAGAGAAPDWVTRARRECAALKRLLADGLKRHPFWAADLETLCQTATAAVGRFERALDDLAPADPACGIDVLRVLMRDVHGLPWSPEEAVALAEDAFRRLGSEIAEHERRHGAEGAAAGEIAPESLPAAYADWHARALECARSLVTPASAFGLRFAPLPGWARDIAGDLYFLSYRCPPALAPFGHSHYWTAPVGQPLVAVKQTHAVHHGSIGHHTQNARARDAASRLARLGGTDCASGVAFLSSGTMIEGWSCYATELMAEADGFYTRAEERALLQADRRNAASVLADIRLHSGAWTLEQMRAFYKDEAGFPAARIWGETTRNSILPATRLMYFLGTEQIKALRREIGGDPRAFHDALISHGHVPVAWVAEEMRRARSGAAGGEMTG